MTAVDCQAIADSSRVSEAASPEPSLWESNDLLGATSSDGPSDPREKVDAAGPHTPDRFAAR